MIRNRALQARQKLVNRLPVSGELLRGSLLERVVRHRSGCRKCERGEGHRVAVRGARVAPPQRAAVPRGARPYQRVMLVSLKCCFSVLLRWFAKLLRALALILCHALLAAPLHQRWD